MRNAIVVVVKLGLFRLNTGFESLIRNYTQKFISFKDSKQLNTISIVCDLRAARHEERFKLNVITE